MDLFKKIAVVAAIIMLPAAGAFAQVGAVPAKPGETVFTRCWVYPLEGAAGAVLGDEGGRSYIGTLGGGLISVSSDGRKAWANELGGEITSNIAVNSEVVLVVTTSAGTTATSTLRGISRETGIARWSVSSGRSTRQWVFLSGENAIMVTDDGTVSAVSLGAGKAVWTRVLQTPVTAASSLDGSILVAGSDGRVILISGASGEVSTLQRIDTGVYAVANASSDTVFVGDGRGTISLFGHGQKPLWKYRTGGAISNIIAAHDRVIITSNDNFVYSITAYNGSVAWKRRLGGRAGVLGVLDGGLLIAGTTDGGFLTAIDAESGKPAGQILLIGEAQVMGISRSEKNSRFRVLTTGALYGYSLRDCS